MLKNCCFCELRAKARISNPERVSGRIFTELEGKRKYRSQKDVLFEIRQMPQVCNINDRMERVKSTVCFEKC